MTNAGNLILVLPPAERRHRQLMKFIVLFAYGVGHLSESMCDEDTTVPLGAAVSKSFC